MKTLTNFLILIAFASIVFSPQEVCSQEYFSCENEKVYNFIWESDETLCEEYSGSHWDSYIGVGTSITKTSQIGSTISGNIYIIGNLEIDNSFEFLNCIVNIYEPVSLNIVSGSGSGDRILKITGSKFFSCSGLWEGIIMDNKSFNTKITITNSEFEDANNVIKLKDAPNTILNVTHSTFNRNIIGILFENTGMLPINQADIGKFYNNYFTCTSPVNNSFDEISYCGIKLINSLFSVNLPYIYKNYFSQLQIGILAEKNSPIIAEDLVFANIRQDGIQMEIGDIHLDHLYETSTFTNCEEHAIDIKEARFVSISSCKIELNPSAPIPEPGPGVYMFGIGIYKLSMNAEITLDIDFKAETYPQTHPIKAIMIKGASDAASSKIIIRNSDFILASFPVGVAIEIRGPFHNTATIDIYNNHFECSPNSMYISQRMNNLHVYGNTIEQNNDGEGRSYGFLMSGVKGENNHIENNTMLFGFGSFYQSINSESVTVCDNVAASNKTSYGFHFEGVALDTEIDNNDIYGTGGALVIKATVMKPQFQKGNRWLPLIIADVTFSASQHAFCDGCNVTQVTSNKFTVHTPQSTSSTLYPYHPQNITPDVMNEFFAQQSGTPQSGCISRSASITEVDILLANDELDSWDDSPGHKWIAQKHLYKKLMENPGLISEDESLEEFIEATEDTPLGKLYDVSSCIETAITPDDSISDYIREFWGELPDLIESLVEVDSLISYETDAADLDTLMNEKSDIYRELNALYSGYDSISSLYKSVVIGKLGACAEMNDDITTSEDYETNEKVFNEIYLKLLAEQDACLLEGQIEDLSIIAEQCIVEGGSAVYDAYYLLPDCVSGEIVQCDTSTNEIYDPIIDTLERHATTLLNNIQNLQFKIIPNPSRNQFTIQLPYIPSGNTQVKIFDYTGLLVYENEINAMYQSAIYHELQPGIYFVIVENMTVTSLPKKLVVIN